MEQIKVAYGDVSGLGHIVDHATNIITSLIPVTPLEEVSFYPYKGNASYVYGYSENNMFVCSISNSNWKFTVPEGVYFVRIVTNNVLPNNTLTINNVDYQAVEGDIFVDSNEEYAVMPLEEYQALLNSVRELSGVEDELKSGEIVECILKNAMPVMFDGAKICTRHVIVPDDVTTLGYSDLYFIGTIRTVYAPEVTVINGNNIFGRAWNSMQEIICPKLTDWGTFQWSTNGALIKVQAGSIGYPVIKMANAKGFTGNNSKDLVITIYVDAQTLAEVPTDISDYAPFGAINATIVYRNSTTGDVISE